MLGEFDLVAMGREPSPESASRAAWLRRSCCGTGSRDWSSGAPARRGCAAPSPGRRQRRRPRPGSRGGDRAAARPLRRPARPCEGGNDPDELDRLRSGAMTSSAGGAATSTSAVRRASSCTRWDARRRRRPPPRRARRRRRMSQLRSGAPCPATPRPSSRWPGGERRGRGLADLGRRCAAPATSVATCGRSGARRTRRSSSPRRDGGDRRTPLGRARSSSREPARRRPGLMVAQVTGAWGRPRPARGGRRHGRAPRA